MLRLILEIHQIGDTRLHTVGHFILSNTGIDFQITRFHFLGLVDFGNSIEHITTHVPRYTIGVG